MHSSVALLEAYFDAKDRNRPGLIRDIYATDAQVTFSIATDAISFPARLAGSEEIARVLVSEFAERFEHCRSYYVCDAVQERDHGIDHLPWRVVMKEVGSPRLRVGAGHYRWVFGRTDACCLQVRQMHIHIDRMETVDDPDDRLRTALQSRLPYPWLTPVEWGRHLRLLQAIDPAFGFLRQFEDLDETATA